MGLNDTVSADRVHIGFFGLRNAGKSSVVNAVTGQKLSLVSEVKGTTTDPVQKAMELLPIGPVVIIDTPGVDDVGVLGEMRVKRALQVLAKTDVAVLVADAAKGLQPADLELLRLFEEKNLPHIIAYNKCDLLATLPPPKQNSIYLSAQKGLHVFELKEQIGRLAGQQQNGKTLVGDLLSPGDVAVLVTPIDAAAPKGRMILPQLQVMRDVLDHHAVNVVTQTDELQHTLNALAKPPKIVITDSQAFGAVSRVVPPTIALTSFSILFARYKGNLAQAVQGAAVLDRLKEGNRVLISEGCTHHRQCGDIGTQKLPAWLEQHCGCRLQFEFTSGTEFPEKLTDYALVVHCGACMLNEREVLSRSRRCMEQGVPLTNYGTAIAHVHGILRRALTPFPQIAALLENGTA